MSARVGTDSSKFPGTAGEDAVATLERAASLGLEGVFFRSLFELSPDLDPGRLADVAAAARDLDMYLEVGMPKVNPFALPAFPEIRELGDGDVVLAFEKMIRAAAAAGVTELWTATANYQFGIRGLYACDRFRTDVSWTEQLAATGQMLERLGPVLRDVGAHLNLETHEEITSFEVVRLVEDAGPDAFGITFDTANVLVRCEDPVAAARRVAPYVRMTHVRDAALHFTEDGIGRFLAPVGAGVIDWPAVLAELVAYNPDLHLSIEGVRSSRAEMSLFLDDPRWQEGHPDLTVTELLEVIRLTRGYGHRAAGGGALGLEALRGPVDDAESLAFVTASAARLRTVLSEIGASTTPTPVLSTH